MSPRERNLHAVSVGTHQPVNGWGRVLPLTGLPVPHKTMSHRLSDGSHPRQTGPVAIADGDGSEP
jgi:hypothetical protein